MQRDRAFSFDSDDGGHGPGPGPGPGAGHAHAHEQDQVPHHQQERYRDSPERPTIRSPPPHYFSPPTTSEPVSPVSAYRPLSTHSRHSSRHDPSFELPRRSIVITNNDPPPPIPPVHRTSPHRDVYRPDSNVTNGMDNYGPQSQGDGIVHVAQEVADHHHRDNGFEAARSLPSDAAGPYPPTSQPSPFSIPRRPLSRSYGPGSSASGFPLTAGAATPGMATPRDFSSTDAASSRQSMRSLPQSYYAMGPVDTLDNSPYQRRSHYQIPNVDDSDILPHNIIDDGDDGFLPEPKRRSMLSGSRQRSREALGRTGGAATAGAGAGAGAGVGAGAGMLGAMFGRKDRNATDSSPYNAVSASDTASADKSEWLASQTKSNHKMRWIIGVCIAVVVVIAVVGGVVGGILGTKHNSSGGTAGGSINNAADDTAANGDLNINSAEIKRLLNNKNLHKVFPGMDYTPWGVQYPLCLTYPPSQNNVTRDMAVLSQLTNAVRLYGTDCNQTEMVLHAIDRLQLKDMKIWLGVWIDPNVTTTNRQLDQMYQILKGTPDHSIFKGVIIGNEALFRAGEDKAQSRQELVSYLDGARSNFSTLGYDLTVSTSDLGDNWDASLASASDFVMSNVHPFFAGVNVNDAASWTWDFWYNHDVVLTGKQSNQVIAETGWPSGGGTDCGNTQNVCATGQTGSVASIDNMNTFMNDWVCQALANSTNYFWFSAFDEAWKVVYNTPGKEWEDKWGLMDTARNLKSGLKIPDCGGKTVS